MTFIIDTGAPDTPAIIPQSACIDPGMGVSLRDFNRAERLHRKIIANIETFETQAEAENYMEAEAPILDVMREQQPGLWEAVTEAYQSHRACVQ